MTSISKYKFEINIIAAALTVAVLFSPIDFAQAACATPTANAGALDFQGGVFKYCDGTTWQDLGGGGATTDASLLTSGTLADARLSSNVPLKNAANTFSVGGQQITNTVVGTIPLTIRAAAGQTATLTEWEDSVGTTIYGLAPGGVPVATTDLTNKAYVDTSVGNYVLKAGDTMTGALVNNTNSASTALAVTQSGAGFAATFMGGFAGFGTAAPATQVHALGGTTPAIMAETTDNTDTILDTLSVRRKRSNSTQPAPNHGAALVFDHEGSVNNTIVTASRIGSGWEQTQSDATTTRDSYLAFGTSLNATVAEKMRIDSAGNVGIGITNPARLLHVNGPIRVQPAALPGTGVAGDIAIDSGASNELKYYNGSAWVSLGGGGAGDFMKDGSVAMAGAFQSIDGISTAPGITFATEPGIGIFRQSAGKLAFATGSGTYSTMDSTGFDSTYSGSWYMRRSTPSATAPVYSFMGNTNTGLFNPAANAIAASTGGTERMRIDSSGNVGIGTTAPTTTLDVRSTTPIITVGDTGDLQGALYLGNPAHGIRRNFVSNSNDVGVYTTSGDLHLSSVGNAQGQFILKNSGNVGIGTTNPTQKLEIVGPVGDSNAPIQMIKAGATDGQLGFGVNTNYAWIQSHNTKPLYINELANNTIINKAGGNVGIGTTAPIEKFTVQGAAMSVASSLAVYNGRGIFGYGGNASGINSAGGVQIAAQGAFNSPNGSANIRFFTSADSGSAFVDGAYTERMTILQGGNVGIGTASPDRLLHVNGPMRVQPAALPGTGAAGDIAIDSGASNALKYYNGTAWVTAGGGASTTDASLLTSGTLADGRLSANVAMKNVANTFSVGGQQITNNAAATIPLTIRAAGSQTATLTRWEDSVGALIYGLSANGVPTAATDIADKGYVDTAVGNYVLKAGDTMSGELTLPGAIVGGGSSSNWATLDVGGANSINANGHIYSYSRICAGNASGSCDSTGGIVMAPNGAAAGSTFLTGSGTSYFSGGGLGVNTATPQATLGVAGASENSAAGIVRHYRSLAEYQGSGSVTGTMKIKMPKSWSDTMVTVTIRGYDYTTATGAWEVIVGGYNYAGSTQWINYSAQINGKAPFSTVRLAHDGGTNVILLGTTASVFNYPAVVVSDMTAAYSQQTGWGTGWTITQSTSEAGIGSIVTPPLLNTGLNYVNKAGDSSVGSLSFTQGNSVVFPHANQSDSNDGRIASGLFAEGLNIVGTQTVGGNGRKISLWGSLHDTGTGGVYWHSGNLTNLNQLTNGPGYITSAVTSLGYTPVNKAGDTMTGRLGQSVSGFVVANKPDITTRTDSGFYEESNATIAKGWPTNGGGWYHLMSSTHSNDANYYAMQFAGDFYNSNEIYYRATAASGTTSWNKMWHAGNLTNLNQLTNGPGYITSAVSSLGYTPINKAGDTATGAIYFQSNKGATSTVGANNTYGLEAYSTDGGAAGMSFHRSGAYAVNMGLDPDNVLRIGGWSAAANRWQLDMSGNETIAGNLALNSTMTFSAANPTISASSYVTVPGGAYFSGGTVYTEAAIQARGGISNDTAASLTLNGGTSGRTQINGAIIMKASVANGSTAINFATGNLQHTTLNCQAFTLSGMLDGGSYTFAVKGTGVATCSFTHAGLTVHMPSDHGATTTGKHTLYTFLVMGADMYVSWMPDL